MAAAAQPQCSLVVHDSRACRACHLFSKEILAKQKQLVRPIHAPVLEGKATCIDCHKGSGMGRPE